jgi:hypothetical protein
VGNVTKKRVALGATCALLGAAAAQSVLAASWTPVAQTSESVYLLDESSIERRSGFLTAWELVEYALPQEQGGVSYRSQMNLRAYRCDRHDWDVLRVTRFASRDNSGEAVLSSRFDPADVTWHSAAPDTVADVLLQRVCTLAGQQHG